MGCCTKLLLIFALIAVFVGVKYYVPVPVEFSKPWPVRISMAVLEIVYDLSYVASLACPCVEPILIRARLFTKMSVPADTSSDATVKMENKIVDGIPITVFTPVKAQPNGPAVIYTHGGGWMYGTMEMYEKLIYEMAEETNMKFLAVDWRGALVTPFPGTFDDCQKAARYILQNAKEFDINPNRIAIMGDSAGGNLAASVTLSLRHIEEKPAMQVLIYPVLQALDFDSPSYRQAVNSRLILSTYDMYRYTEFYATGSANSTKSLAQHRHVTSALRKQLVEKYMPLEALPKEVVPADYKRSYGEVEVDEYIAKAITPLLGERFSPLLAKDLTGLPTTYMYTSYYDVVRDENIWYAHRLKKAGVKVEHFIHKASFHGIVSMKDMIPEGQDAFLEITKYVKDNL